MNHLSCSTGRQSLDPLSAGWDNYTSTHNAKHTSSLRGTFRTMDTKRDPGRTFATIAPLTLPLSSILDTHSFAGEMVGAMATAKRRRLRPDDPFLAAGNEIALRNTFTQVFFYTLEHEEASALETMLPRTYPCSALGCHQVFESLEECDSHYFNTHTRECRQCRAVLPNDFLLDLHISEAHDSYFASALERKKAKYSCIIASCKSSFECERARHQHLMEVHLFPRWFRFHHTAKGNNFRDGKGRRQGAIKSGRRGKGKRFSKIETSESCTIDTNADESYDERKQKQLMRKKARKERRKKARALIPCKFHLMEGGCERGDRCDFLHVRVPPVSQSEGGGPASDSDTDMAIGSLSNQLTRS